MKKLIVIEKDPKGNNELFKDTETGREYNSENLIDRLKTGNSVFNEDYHIRTNEDGTTYVCSNPNKSEKDNLG